MQSAERAERSAERVEMVQALDAARRTLFVTLRHVIRHIYAAVSLEIIALHFVHVAIHKVFFDLRDVIKRKE